jgi:hypothetical protein
MDVYDAEIGSEARENRDGDGDGGRGATSAHRAGSSHEPAIVSNAPCHAALKYKNLDSQISIA